MYARRRHETPRSETNSKCHMHHRFINSPCPQTPQGWGPVEAPNRCLPPLWVTAGEGDSSQGEATAFIASRSKVVLCPSLLQDGLQQMSMTMQTCNPSALTLEVGSRSPSTTSTTVAVNSRPAWTTWNSVRKKKETQKMTCCKSVLRNGPEDR